MGKFDPTVHDPQAIHVKQNATFSSEVKWWRTYDMEANQKKIKQSRSISVKQGRLQRRQKQDGSEEGPHVRTEGQLTRRKGRRHETCVHLKIRLEINRTKRANGLILSCNWKRQHPLLGRVLTSLVLRASEGPKETWVPASANWAELAGAEQNPPRAEHTLPSSVRGMFPTTDCSLVTKQTLTQYKYQVCSLTTKGLKFQ